MPRLSDAEWKSRVDYIVEYAKKNNSLPKSDWEFYAWMFQLKKNIDCGRVSDEKLLYIERVFPGFIKAQSLSDLNDKLHKRGEGSKIPISVVMKKFSSLNSDFYNEIKKRNISTVEDALDLLNTMATGKKKVSIEFSNFIYTLFCEKYPSFYENTYAEYRRLLLLQKSYPGSFYTILFNEVNTTDKNGKWDLSYLGYAYLYAIYSMCYGLGSGESYVRYVNVLCSYYGISTLDKVTIDMISKETGVTRNYVSIRVGKAERLMSHPIRYILKTLISDSHKYDVSDCITLSSRYRISSEELVRLSSKFIEMVSNSSEYEREAKSTILKYLRININETGVKKVKSFNKENAKAISDKSGLDSIIEEFDLSVRCFNSLKRAGIHTIKDLVYIAKRKENLLKIRNLGRGTLEEVVELLDAVGYTYLDGELVNKKE